MWFKICVTALIVTIVVNAIDDHFRKSTGSKEYKGSDAIVGILSAGLLTFIVSGIAAIWSM